MQAAPHSAAADPAPRLARATLGLVVITTGLIVLGALVRANGAGLACPDWPLCFGEVIPPIDLRVGFEFGHRVLAGSVGLGFLAIGFVLLRNPASRQRAGRVWGIAAVLLAAQVLLGGLTVLQLLARWTVTSHLLTGNAFNACLLVLALRLRTDAAQTRPAVSTGARGAATLAGALLLAQMALGGLVSSSYAGLVCPEWPTCLGGHWAPSFEGTMGLHVFHRLNGYAFVLAAGATWLTARGTPGLAGWAGVLIALATSQIAVGVANVLLETPVEVTGLHSLMAALLVLTQTRVLFEAWRRPGAPRSPAAAPAC